MIKVEYPNYPFKIKEEKNNHFIFDEIRKKWVVLTPEEWVRQNFIQYLIQTIHIPASVIAIEKQIKFNDITKRCDIIVYKNATPYIIIECKEQNVEISEKTLQQILIYNQKLQVAFLVITNGKRHFIFNTKQNKWENEFPLY